MALWSNKDSGAITGLVGITGPTFGTLTGTSVAAASTYYNVPQKGAVVSGGAGTGATFTITKTGTGTAYAGFTTITASIPAGAGYNTSSVIKLSGANLGGADGTNDLTIPLTGLPLAALNGTVGTFTQTGTAVAQTQTYTGVVQKAGGTTTGTGAVFSVARTGGTSYATNTVVTVTTPGTGYLVGDTVVISGALIGGVVTTNDMTVTITALPTSFSSELKAGSFVWIGSSPATKYKILKVDSNILATLTSNYEAATVTAGTVTKHTAPTSLSLADARNAVFVSQEEALLTVNKAKGFTGAGWWLHKEYNDASGKPRYKSELLVAMTVPEATSSDAPASSGEDLFASDTASVVTLTTSPAGKTTSGGTATFGAELVASASSGTLTYQWQRALAATPTRFVNINGATSATVVTPGTQTSANTGDLYRVILSSTNGAPKVTSASAVLTFGT